MGSFYILRGHEVVETRDMAEAGAVLLDLVSRTVRKTPIETCEVSTVFLGTDHNYTREGPPIVFETLVMGGPMDDWMRRYATWDEAEAGHIETVELVRRAYEGERPPEDDVVVQKFERRTWHERVLGDDDIG